MRCCIFFIFEHVTIDVFDASQTGMAAKSINITDYRRQLPGEIRDGAYYFPTITATNRTSGRNTFWTIYVRVFDRTKNPNYADGERGSVVDKFNDFQAVYLDNKPLSANLRGWIKVDSGVEGGKVKESAPTIVRVGKNVGRANATNVVCQALRDALSQYNAQLRRSAPAGATDLYPPMLAKKFEEGKTKLTYPVIVQRKYNGIRTVAFARDSGDDFKVILYSRTRIEYPGLDYLRDDLRPLFLHLRSTNKKNMYIDGELYKHGVPLQKITGDGRREDTIVADYSFMVYDCFDLDDLNASTRSRVDTITALINESNCEFAVAVESYDCADLAEIKARYQEFLDEAYEGLMIRPAEAKYVFSVKGYHSGNLLKMKPRHDAEYELVDWFVAENGKAQGLLMVVCKTEDGKLFNVTPSMDVLSRQELAAKMGNEEENGKTYFENVWKGVQITVDYDEKSNDGIPLRGSTKLNTRVDAPPAP